MLNYYKNQLGQVPFFMNKYLNTPSLLRLKRIGYFCGMDYASKDIYQFAENITRFDHSLTAALLTYHLAKDKKSSVAGLYHDISTPCFSHVIDYMNKDYENQESTEGMTEEIIKQDKELRDCLKEDHIDIEDVIHFKNYSIVDNDRPKLCADRLDGLILTSIGWSKNIKKEEISKILNHLKVYQNEDKEQEIGFTSQEVGNDIVEKSIIIDELCHTKEDNYMMDLLSKITKLGLQQKLYTYKDLYYLDEKEILRRLLKSNNKEILELLQLFFHIKKEQIPNIDLPYIKRRNINPLINGKRIK